MKFTIGLPPIWMSVLLVTSLGMAAPDRCSSNAKHVGTHCVCDGESISSTCIGTKCSSLKEYNPELCHDCHCMAHTSIQRSPKIFVYDLPAAFNRRLLTLPQYFDCRTSMYAAEVIIHEQLLNSSYRTLDPEDADYFFVPIYSTCYRAVRAQGRKLKGNNPIRHDPVLQHLNGDLHEDMLNYIHSAVDYVSSTSPYWTRENGRDHIFPFTHDFGGCFTIKTEIAVEDRRLRLQNLLKNSILLQYFGELDSPCFSPWKDIVIPPFVADESLGHTYLSPEKREGGLYFRGRLEWNQKTPTPEYGRGVRKELFKKFYGNAFFNFSQAAVDHDKYLKEMQSHKFCLAPPGFAAWSPRIVEAIQNGCIPTVIADGNMLPFESLKLYQHSIVKVLEKNALNLDSVLKGLSQTELKRKGDELRKIRGHFVYNQPFKPDDAFDTIMKLLRKKIELHSLANRELY